MGVKRALISDIHGNLEALQAVLEDIGQEGVDEIFCLGDVVGYGPNPTQCLELVMSRCRITILGNHDQATLFDPNGFNPVALQAIYWTRDQLEVPGSGPDSINRRWDFLGELPRLYNEGEFLFVHGSPRDPTQEYVFPEDVYNSRKMDAIFGRFERYCFTGHTHIPGVFTHSREFLTPEEIGFQFKLTNEKALINVGSVGQPRDNDPRACYTILEREESRITFKRVEYQVNDTAQKIYKVHELDNMLGDRLRTGR